jgi:hypothetical protein
MSLSQSAMRMCQLSVCRFLSGRHVWPATLGAACVLLAACGGGGVADKPVGPVTPVDTTKPPGTVQRATLAVTVSFDPEDAGIASAAGVTPAGITVRIQRIGTNEPARTAATGADGVARFTELLEGGYQVSVDRPLTSAEVARLPEADREASLFAGGTGVVVTPPQGQTAVQLVASRRGSLVISEQFLYRDNGKAPFYGMGTYVEVYNNADTTIYLDGVLFFRSRPQMHRDFDIAGGCTGNAPYRLDPLGIWASLIWAFPGAGREYPIRPGEAKVIAMDALNHAAASPTTDQLDLSAAHFEQIGTDADINNPFVPDMIRVMADAGVLGRGYPTGHGIVIGLVLPAARTRLSAPEFLGGGDVVRVPREFILDLMSVSSTPAVDASLRAFNNYVENCEPWLLPVFERAPAPLGDATTRMAVARRSLGRSAAGHEILQRTRTSARDLVHVFPLRRSLLK